MIRYGTALLSLAKVQTLSCLGLTRLDVIVRKYLTNSKKKHLICLREYKTSHGNRSSGCWRIHCDKYHTNYAYRVGSWAFGSYLNQNYDGLFVFEFRFCCFCFSSLLKVSSFAYFFFFCFLSLLLSLWHKNNGDSVQHYYYIIISVALYLFLLFLDLWRHLDLYL